MIENWCIIRARSKSGDVKYLAYAVISNSLRHHISDKNPVLLDATAQSDISKALVMMKEDHQIDTHTIEIVFLNPVSDVYEDQERADMVQRIGLSVLSRSEIKALGLEERMVYHKLATDM